MLRNINDLKAYVNGYIIESLALKYKILVPRGTYYCKNINDAIVLLQIMSLDDTPGSGEIVLLAGIELPGHTERVPIVGYGVFKNVSEFIDDEYTECLRKPLAIDADPAWAIAKAFYYWSSGSRVDEINLLEEHSHITDEIFRDIMNAGSFKGRYH